MPRANVWRRYDRRARNESVPRWELECSTLLVPCAVHGRHRGPGQGGEREGLGSRAEGWNARSAGAFRGLGCSRPGVRHVEVESLGAKGDQARGLAEVPSHEVDGAASI